MFHSFGQTCGLNLMMSVGGCLTLRPRFDAGRALEIIERDRVTLFERVPTMFAAMVAYEGEVDASRLELCASGGAAMPLDVIRRFEERFGCIVLEGYGLSETSPIASFSRADRERKPGSIGCRSTASRCGSSTTTAPRCHRARSERSRFEATTS